MMMDCIIQIHQMDNSMTVHMVVDMDKMLVGFDSFLLAVPDMQIVVEMQASDLFDLADSVLVPMVKHLRILQLGYR